VSDNRGSSSPPPARDDDAVERDYAFRVYAVDDDDEIRLKDLWLSAWRGRWLIAAASVGTAFVAVLLSFLITPVYRASVLVAPTSEAMAGGGLAALAAQIPGVAALTGLSLGGNARTAESVATLRSRGFTESFIREHDLMPILFADRWDAEGQRWQEEPPPTLWSAFELFNSVREIEEDVETGLYTLEVTWSDPKLAAEWANSLVTDVNRVLRTRAITESTQNLNFLRGELEKSSQVPLQTTIYGLIEAEMKNAMLANVRQEYAFRVIDPARVPEWKSWPKRTLIALLGLFAGLTIGTFVALMRESSSRKP